MAPVFYDPTNRDGCAEFSPISKNFYEDGKDETYHQAPIYVIDK
jgi:hypothetical protein